MNTKTSFKRPLKIAFDLDNCLWIKQNDYNVPNYGLIAVLKWFYNNGDDITVWSGGGVEYCEASIAKLGLGGMVRVEAKTMDVATCEEYDMAFDDSSIALAHLNIGVKTNAKEQI